MDMGSCSSKDVFALQVRGNSMAPEFKDGAVIIIDPQGHVQDKSYVVANVKGELVFRQIRIEGENYSLHTLDGSEPVDTIDDLEAIEGVVVQQAGRRRKDRKFYRPEGLS